MNTLTLTISPKKTLLLLLGVLAFVLLIFSGFDEAEKSELPEPQVMEGYIGEVKMFAGNFAPRGWALCQGQLLAISSNSALFSILGTTYGGDGRTTFALPDLRGRTAVGTGAGPGLSDRNLGTKFGSENLSLPLNGISKKLSMEISRSTAAYNVLQGSPVSSMSPALGMNYIICLTGIYPSRN
ncbi:MAG: tail fiber protein [Bacteroidia bacterium]|nr:tail fiber protein [Bacteroidia bacterium]